MLNAELPTSNGEICVYEYVYEYTPISPFVYGNVNNTISILDPQILRKTPNFHRLPIQFAICTQQTNLIRLINITRDNCMGNLYFTVAMLLFALSTGATMLDSVLKSTMKDRTEIIFCTRSKYDDGHWYANIGYYSDDSNKKAYTGNGKPDKSVLYRYNLKTKERKIILNANGGSIRDPHVDYDGKRILFSYRPNGTHHYNLYTINADGSALHQITHGPWDDIEAIFLPDGDILFVSTRCKRYVSCWYTQVATMYRCKPDGTDITSVSTNIEHDNTPAVMPDGRILYTRWEYVDRSQVEYHHLWTMNPDGTGVNVYFGNMHSWTVMIDAQPIPGTQDVIASFSPGHGRNEHAGFPTVVSQLYGPDKTDAAKKLNSKADFRDPQALTKDLFIMAQGKQIILMNRKGDMESLYKSDTENVHEPRLLAARTREPIIPSRTDPAKENGTFILIDVYKGRNMTGIKRGDIKKLLILEVLPKPINFSGGMDITTWNGSFNLERTIGTVPVEEDGSAHFTAPANRPLFFVALDKNNLSVKRMQSFTDLMPGEQTTCIGCHETRTTSPYIPAVAAPPLAVKRSPSKIYPFTGIPDVLDFNRDIQPILDNHCIKCHNPKMRKGRVDLSRRVSSNWSPAYVTLLANKQVADGRNGLGNQPPRSIGSAASPLLTKLSGSHHKVKASEKEWLTAFLWIETAAPYCGSYAGVRNSKDQHLFNTFRSPAFGPFGDVNNRRCAHCHKNEKDKNTMRIPFDWDLRRKVEAKKMGLKTAAYERVIIKNDPIRLYSWDLLLNFKDPELSNLLLAPLAKEAGGLGLCSEVVFKNKEDKDYQKLLKGIQESKKRFTQKPAWSEKGWKPNHQYIQEMKRYGILNESFDIVKDTFDPFAVDQAYWESMWDVSAK